MSVQGIGPNNGSRHDPERIDDTSIEYEIRDLLENVAFCGSVGFEDPLARHSPTLHHPDFRGVGDLAVRPIIAREDCLQTNASNFPKTWQTYWCPLSLTDPEAWVTSVESNE